jgi:hypothetical protein
MNALIRDLHYALRALAKNPGFSIAAILSRTARREYFHLQHHQRVSLRPLP